MKIACFIPIKENSKRILRKNFQKIQGKELYKIGIDCAIESKAFDEIYVDTDSNEIKKYALSKKIKVINRDPKLSKDTANGNHLLAHWVNLYPEYDLYFQYHVTSPLTKTKTISNCVNILKTKKQYDSIFTGIEVYSWFWFDNTPVNYDPKILPRSQDAIPVIRETTALYGINRDTFNKLQCRIGKNPYFYIVGEQESLDVDNQIDLEYCRYMSVKTL